MIVTELMFHACIVYFMRKLGVKKADIDMAELKKIADGIKDKKAYITGGVTDDEVNFVLYEKDE